MTDSENKTRYEGQLCNMTGDNIKPYILIYKSNVKITINWVFNNILFNWTYKVKFQEHNHKKYDKELLIK